jgi:hypothetical protein
MMITFWQVLTWLTLLAVPFVTAFHAVHEDETAGTVVKVVPASGSYGVGGQIQVEIRIVDVQDLYGADVKLAFDPALLQVVDADPNIPGVQITPRDDLLSPDFVIKNEADNQAGTVWYAVTQLNPTPPASGTGALFSFTFSVVGSGTANLSLEQQLATRTGAIIPAEGRGATYDLVESTIIYLPIVMKDP